MKYNPDVHHRRSIRLKGYDYSWNGAYFVTLCTFDRSCYFDRFRQLREIVDGQWQMIPERFSYVDLDEYVIMPNHVHGIIVIHDNRRDTPRGYPDSSGYPDSYGYPKPLQGHPRGAPLQINKNVVPTSSGHPSPTQVSLGDIVGAYKSLCVNAWLKAIKTEDINARGKFWQDNYYEHIIRNEEETDRIRKYIVNNPLQWELDRENPAQCEQQPQSEKWMV